MEGSYLRWGRGWREARTGLATFHRVSFSTPGICPVHTLPLPPPSLQASGLFFNGIGHGLRCKRMIAMEFFADNRQQRGYGRLPGDPQVLIGAMKRFCAKWWKLSANCPRIILGPESCSPNRTAGLAGVGVPPVPDFIRPLRDGRLRWDGRSREVALDSLLPTHALKKGAWMGHPPLLAGREWDGLGLCLPTLRQEKGKGWGTHLCWRVESGMV